MAIEHWCTLRPVNSPLVQLTEGLLSELNSALEAFGMEAARSAEGNWTFNGVMNPNEGWVDGDWVVIDVNVRVVFTADFNNLSASRWQLVAGPTALYSTETPQE